MTPETNCKKRAFVDPDGCTITLYDDGYRIYFTVEVSPNIDPQELFLWAEYKQCEWPRPAMHIADFLMREGA